MESPKVFVTSPSLPDFNEYVEEIKSIWDTRHLTNMGPKHQQLEQELKDYMKVKHIDLFANGHLALQIALRALPRKGGEIITTPFTFASTTHAIVESGYIPVFCDINEVDFTIDVDKIEELITDKTVAIVPVHIYGVPCDVYRIEEIARKHKLKVIYDAAHTFGVKVDGKGIGSFGDISMFSFHATKVYNTVEGGCLTFNNEELGEDLRALRSFGMTGPEQVEYVGTNAKMTEFHAAMGLCNLRHIEENIDKRKVLVERYVSRLQNKKGITLVPIGGNVKSNYAYFPVVFHSEECGVTRDQVIDTLAQYNIYARKYFYPLTNQFQCYVGSFDLGHTPVAEFVSKNVLTLPLYADMEITIVDRICDIIETMLNGGKV